MANIPLSSIKFPGLTGTYTVPDVDANLSTSGAAADAKKTGDELTALKADFNALGLSVVDGKLCVTYRKGEK